MGATFGTVLVPGLIVLCSPPSFLRGNVDRILRRKLLEVGSRSTLLLYPHGTFPLLAHRHPRGVEVDNCDRNSLLGLFPLVQSVGSRHQSEQ